MRFWKLGFFCLLKCGFKIFKKCTTSADEVHILLGVYLFGKLICVSKNSVDLGVCTLIVTEISFHFIGEVIYVWKVACSQTIDNKVYICFRTNLCPC
jgi:hypothetical protein